MPNQNGTGPKGLGSGTGRGLGKCNNNSNSLGRPCLRRQINFDPDVTFFKPQGIKLNDLKVVELKAEELEALRLKNLHNLDQKQCADKMKTSPATLQRIISSANKKITQALVNGEAIKILTQK